MAERARHCSVTMPGMADTGETSSRRPGRPRQHAGQSARERLLETASREFGRRGFADVSVGELVALADVTSPVLYHHFGSKLGLFFAAAETAYDRTLDGYRRVVAECSTFTDIVEALIDESARFMREEPTVAMMICTMQFELRRDPAIGTHLRQRLVEFREFFDRVAEAAPHRLRPTAEATRDLSHLLIAITAGTATESMLLARPDHVDGMFRALHRWVTP
jgi:AcrR family transcriptional regulator